MIGLPTPRTVELKGYVTGNAIRDARSRNPDARIIANGKTVSLGSRADLQMNMHMGLLATRRESAPPTAAENQGYNNELGRPLVESASGSIMAGTSIGGASQPTESNVRMFGPALNIPSIPPSTL